MEISLPPKKYYLSDSGIPPAAIKLTKAVMAASKGLDCLSCDIMSLICCGVRPSGPPDDPGGNDKIVL